MRAKRRFHVPVIALVVISMIIAIIPLNARNTYAAQTITIEDGEYNISALIEEQGLSEGDTLEVGGSATLVVDADFMIDRILPASMGDCKLTIKGEKTLTVLNGINLGTYGSFTMESGTAQITGPYPSGNPSSAIYAPTITINGGKINIVFDDPSNPNQCGFETEWFTLNDGQVTVDISGSGSGYTSGIYSRGSDCFAIVNGGTLDIDVENSFGYPYGIYNDYKNYTIEINGGSTNIKSRRTNSESNYAYAGGIAGESFDGEGLNLYLNDGSLTVDVVNYGQDAYGITGGYFNIAGGTLDVYAGTEKEGRCGWGIKTDEDAVFLMSGGNAKVQGSTYSTASGIGRGIEYWNTNPTRRIDISGGILTAIGMSGAGIYVYNSSDNTPGQNQIYGDAKVIVEGGYTEASIYGVRDGGWKVFGNAELTSTGVQFNGLYTSGPLEFADTPAVTLTGNSISGINRCAVCAVGGITIGDTLEILADGGPGEVATVESGSAYINNSDKRYAKEVVLRPKDLVKAYVLFYDEVTGTRITDGSAMVYKNSGPWQAASSEPVILNVPKGENFTLTAGEVGGYYTFNGWYRDGYPGTLFNKNSTITQNISTDTWYYAEFSPPKTEIKSITLTSDKVPVTGMTRVDRPSVSIAEDGITITGTAWLDMDGHHLAEDYVFAEGDQVMLMIDYVVDKAYKLSGDIESFTFLNGDPVSVNDVADTAIYQFYTVSQPKNGWEKEDGVWYYYIDGVKQTGWLSDGSAWYYLDETGRMLTGWQKVGNTWYYLKDSGAMATGWQQISGTWYYLKDSGAMATGWQQINGTWYYFRDSGAMATGWIQVNDIWYYFKDSGAMVTGWQSIGGKWYYFKSSGAMAANEWCEGYWLNADGSWTYQPKGSWKQDSKGWWFGDSSGWYAKNSTVKIDNVNYTFDASGYWVQ